MKSTTLIVLVGVTAVIGTAAALVSSRGRATVKSEVATELLFPDLGAKVNDVASVTVKRADKEFTFKRTATGWEASDKGGYPAKVEKIKETLIALSQLRSVEPKTSKPENYSKIGVEDPGTFTPPPSVDPGTAPLVSNATLLTLKDDKGQTISAVIVGNPRWESKPGTYIRKAGDAQAWLADGRVEAPTEFTAWVDTQFASVPKDRIKKAEITFADGTKTTVSREKADDANFTVHNIPAGEELMGANAGDAVANAISFLSLENVAPAETIFPASPGPETPKAGPSSEFQTFDGMKILIQTAEKDGKSWAHFVAAYDESLAPPPAPTPEPKPGETPPPAPKKPEEVQKEVTDFNNKTARWAFQIPDYKASAFKTTVASMLKSKPPTPPPSLNEGNAAAPLSPLPLPGQPPAPPQNPPPAAPAATGPTSPITPAPAPDTKPESPIKPPETPPQPAPAPTGG